MSSPCDYEYYKEAIKRLTGITQEGMQNRAKNAIIKAWKTISLALINLNF